MLGNFSANLLPGSIPAAGDPNDQPDIARSLNKAWWEPGSTTGPSPSSSRSQITSISAGALESTKATTTLQSDLSKRPDVEHMSFLISPNENYGPLRVPMRTPASKHLPQFHAEMYSPPLRKSSEHFYTPGLVYLGPDKHETANCSYSNGLTMEEARLKWQAMRKQFSARHDMTMSSVEANGNRSSGSSTNFSRPFNGRNEGADGVSQQSFTSLSQNAPTHSIRDVVASDTLNEEQPSHIRRIAKKLSRRLLCHKSELRNGD